jgi:glycosyltransferase involved in cell wall biosynthesis
MSNPPFISIVMPSYNQAAYLERAIVSVLDQGYEHRELIIMDGGSSDGSVGIIEKYAARLAYWQSGKDEGQSSAINAGFSRARGSLYGWLNSDDELMPRALSCVAEWFAEHPNAQFVYGDSELIDENSNVTKTLREPYWNEGWQRYVRNCVAQSSAFWRRELWTSAGGVDASLQYAMDYDLWFRMSRLSALHHVDRVLSRQRQHCLTKTATGKAEHEAEKRMVRSGYYGEESPLRSSAMFLIYKLHRVVVKALRGRYVLHQRPPHL